MVSIWLEFHTKEAERVAGFYLETTMPHPAVLGIPLPPKYRLISCQPSARNKASVDLVLTNGGSPITQQSLDEIQRHVEEYYLLAPPRAMRKYDPQFDLSAIERRVTAGFITQ